MTWILGSEQNINYCNQEEDVLLKKSKFLSEFKTKSERRKVLENLGINGITSWGQIDGFIENQKDLWGKFTEIQQNMETLITEAINKINSELFPLTVAISEGGVFEVGTTQDITISWSIKEGNDIVIPDSIVINDTSVDVNSTSYKFTDITDTTTFTISITKGETTVTASTTATFVHASYFGAIESVFNLSEIDSLYTTTLIKSVKNTKNYTNTIDLNNQKILYIYPKDFGELSSIKDSNNFDYIDSYTHITYTTDRWSLDDNNVEYYVYLLTNATTINSFTQTFS